MLEQEVSNSILLITLGVIVSIVFICIILVKINYRSSDNNLKLKIINNTNKKISTLYLSSEIVDVEKKFIKKILSLSLNPEDYLILEIKKFRNYRGLNHNASKT